MQERRNNIKAPDKIYIAESLIKKPYGNEWSPTEYVSRENTEYIRKDALLEWAKEGKKQLKSEDAAAIKDDIRYGADAAFDTLIEKLNSM